MVRAVVKSVSVNNPNFLLDIFPSWISSLPYTVYKINKKIANFLLDWTQFLLNRTSFYWQTVLRISQRLKSVIHFWPWVAQETSYCETTNVCNKSALSLPILHDLVLRGVDAERSMAFFMFSILSSSCRLTHAWKFGITPLDDIKLTWHVSISSIVGLTSQINIRSIDLFTYIKDMTTIHGNYSSRFGW